MERAFDPHLDFALSEARNATVISRSAEKNLHAHIANALACIQLNNAVRHLAEAVAVSGRQLFEAHQRSFLQTDQQSIASKLHVFEGAVEKLRQEMHTCHPSDMTIALGLG